jgi:hypothetical protein
MVAALWVTLMAALAGCAPQATRSLGVSAEDVVAIQYYEYPWSQLSESVERLTVDDREVIDERVKSFTDMPAESFVPSNVGPLAGKETQATRFLLKDGSNVEVTKIWVRPFLSVVIWPDGTVSTTEWGSPQLMSAYRGAGTVETVDAAEVPRATLPG